MSDDAGAVVRQWLARADADWRTVAILARQPDSPPETVCFHCQQYVEKLLKALLTLHGIEAPRTHDIRRLVQLAASLVGDLSLLEEHADVLTEHAVAMRYPDEWRHLEADEVKQAINIAERFSESLLSAFK